MSDSNQNSKTPKGSGKRSPKGSSPVPPTRSKRSAEEKRAEVDRLLTLSGAVERLAELAIEARDAYVKRLPKIDQERKLLNTLIDNHNRRDLADRLEEVEERLNSMEDEGEQTDDPFEDMDVPAAESQQQLN